jgi:hypothetical protein
MTSLQNKIQLFNKPNVNADEQMKTQAKKAKFLSKLSKFENLNSKPEEKPSKAEVSKKTRIFESDGTTDEAKEKERELRKQSFKLIKQQFDKTDDKEHLLESDSSGFGSIEDISTPKGSDSIEPTSSSPTTGQDKTLDDLAEQTAEVIISSNDE